MPQALVKNNERMSFRITPTDKSILMRAASIEHTNLTEFVIKTAISAAQEVIKHNECILLSERDSLHILDLLGEPPKPNSKLLAAALALSKNA